MPHLDGFNIMKSTCENDTYTIQLSGQTYFVKRADNIFNYGLLARAISLDTAVLPMVSMGGLYKEQQQNMTLINSN